MKPIRLFISSVQTEFAEERAALREYLRGDALMRRYFEVFLFEDLPAADRRPGELYLEEVEQCDIYIGLFGSAYGSTGDSVDDDGLSPTEREFDHATAHGKYRLIYVREPDEGGLEGNENGEGREDREDRKTRERRVPRDPRMQALIDRAENGLIRKRFTTSPELVTGVYAALVDYLLVKQLLRFGPFDAAPCVKATLSDLDPERIRWFVRKARAIRQFPLDVDTDAHELLSRLNLLDDGHLTNAAILLFGKQPQRYLISSEIKCAHFHGTRVAKPIPSYQVYKGTVFELVDQAIDFVLSKINLSVGTREAGPQAPVAYEIPKEVVAEAIVNAVAHRDYTSNGSVQVMLFADRLEIWNPGSLPPSLSLEKLRVAHGSVPGNPLLAEPMYLTRYIERMGTGTGDMIQHCRDAGLPEPEFAVTDGFQTIIRRVKGGEETTGKTTEETEGTRVETTQETEGTREETTPETESTREENKGTREETTRETESTREENKGTREETTRETERETKEKILSLITDNPSIPMKEMAQKIGISSKGIEWQIKELKKSGRLKRMGSTKSGYWKITGDKK